MSLKIDTITENKKIFNSESEPQGILDLTKASIRYDGIENKVTSVFVVTEDYQMRPDLIALLKYGDVSRVGSLLKYNNISNPFALAEGTPILIPAESLISESFKVKKMVDQKEPSTNKGDSNGVEEFKKTQESKKFTISDGRKKFLQDRIKNSPQLDLPPNVLQPGQKTIEQRNGSLIFAPDAGGGGFNKPII